MSGGCISHSRQIVWSAVKMRIITSLSSIIYNERRAGMLIRQTGMMGRYKRCHYVGIKNHHSSFRNLKLKRLIWQRSVYCGNECHNKIVLFIHTGRNITINMDIIQMFFFIIYFDSASLATQHNHCQSFPGH